MLVVPVPSKASIYPEKLTDRGDRTSPSSRTLNVLAALQTAGVETVDLFEAFHRSRGSGSEPTQTFYLARDTHWSPYGVRAAVRRALAEIFAYASLQRAASDGVHLPIAPAKRAALPTVRVLSFTGCSSIPE